MKRLKIFAKFFATKQDPTCMLRDVCPLCNMEQALGLAVENPNGA
jgi:hypothetical protein